MPSVVLPSSILLAAIAAAAAAAAAVDVGGTEGPPLGLLPPPQGWRARVKKSKSQHFFAHQIIRVPASNNSHARRAKREGCIYTQALTLHPLRTT